MQGSIGYENHRIFPGKPLFSYIDLLNYMLKYKIPQIVTLTLKICIFL